MVESGNQLKWMLFLPVVVTMTLSSRVFGLGEFQLLLYNFQNDRGQSVNATCCHGNASTQTQHPSNSIIPVCHLECRTFFRVCLSHYQANIPADPQCTYGLTTTPVLGGNTFNLSDANGTAYLVAFQFNFTWTGSFSLVIEAFDDLSSSGIPYEGSRRQSVLRLATQRLLSVGQSWTRENFTEDLTGASLVYEFRVICQRNYFGPGCVRVCAPRDDVFGHYDCDADGLRVCRNGWTGSYCETAVCLEGCNDTFGLCITPFECRCRYGWQGRTCDECIRYPDCNHGNCVLPWQCNCFDGWGGQLCNIDLHFCARYQPCLNGGNCSDDGVLNYTCHCPSGFQGRQCDIVDDVCRQEPCQNGATCKATNGTFVCRCPAGFSGVRCESVQTGSLPRGLQEVTQEHQKVTTVSEVLANSHSDESTYISSATSRSASSQGHTSSMSSSSELTWVEITLIVCLGGLLPIVLAALAATIFVVCKQRRERDASRVRSKSSRSVPTAVIPSLGLPKMNNVEEKGSSRSTSLISRDLTEQRKVFNVNCWSDMSDQSEPKWTRRRLQVIGPTQPPEIKLYSPEVQGQRCSETWKNVDRVSNSMGINGSMTYEPWTQGNVFIVPGVQRSQRTRPALEYVSVVASWRYDYPVGSLTTDV